MFLGYRPREEPAALCVRTSSGQEGARNREGSEDVLPK
jgi:hypothetical protein